MTFENHAHRPGPRRGGGPRREQGGRHRRHRQTAASGSRSLKITDAPGLQQAYNPHYVYSNLAYTDGPVRNAFALRVDPGADVHFEWRDYKTGSAYLTGPSVPGPRQPTPPERRPVAQPAGRPVGSIRDRGRRWGPWTTASWTLRVTRPGQPPQEFRDLPYGRPEFAQLTWIGFTSNANDTTDFYLDDFTLNGDE